MTEPSRKDGRSVLWGTSSGTRGAQASDAGSAGSFRSTKLSKVSPARFLLLSLLFHIIYISSIFDIYFTSPVVHPEPRFSLRDTLTSKHTDEHLEAPAKRLMLIVGDGLRADTLFKRHSSEILPPWSTDRDAAFARDGTSGAWTTFAKDPLSQPHPYRLALQENRTAACDLGRSCSQLEHAFAAPFLRSVSRDRGAWGISHTRVPTESRPGHVAMIAGMYEDVSAVTKGWKLNPIAFDSILNQSSHSFAFGSPDIVPMFAVGAAADRVDMWTYNEEDEDFTKDASHLDLWVLEHFKRLLENGSNNAALRKKLEQPGTVFFLHLLGLDTTGHVYRPISPEYVGNTIVVDAIVREVEKLMDDFYGHDGRTTYIFTADHGMSLKGNHGDGDPHNTRTPLVTWGAGVRSPQPATAEQMQTARAEQERDPYFADWHLDDVARVDLAQADITPLMATLLGVPVPANSEGRLRLDLLDVSPEHKARALLANAQQVLETYRVKHASRARRMVRYVPFVPLALEKGETLPGEEKISHIRTSIEEGEFDEAVLLSNALIDEAIEGARYLQTYDWLLLCSVVTIGYLGSIVYSFSFLLRNYILADEEIAANTPNAKPRRSLLKILMAPVSGAVFALFAAQEMPFSYYLYAALAFLFWGRVMDDSPLFIAAFRRIAGSRTGVSIVTILLKLFASLAMLELMAVGYLRREAWFVGFILLGFAWPALGMSADFKSDNEGLILVWGFSCLLNGLFTIGDVNKEESITILMLSAIAFIGAGLVITSYPALFFPASSAREGEGTSAAAGSQPVQDKTRDAHRLHFRHTVQTLRVQLVVLVITAVTTAVSARSLSLKQGLPAITQGLAWVCLATCLVFPFAYGFRRPITVDEVDKASSSLKVRQPSSQRLAIVVFAFAPVFVLLSLRDEVLFFGSFIMTLLVWAKLEGALHETSQEAGVTGAIAGKRHLQIREIRISLFYLFFLHIGFFGTGNVASISSFYLSPVYRLVPVFDPFLMATLLLLKILVPFVILNAIFSLMATTPRLASLPSGKKALDRGLKLLGDTAPGGLGLDSGLSLVFGAGIAADVLALNFLFAVKSEGSWLEIGQTITHFVMANLLQIFMLALAAASTAILG